LATAKALAQALLIPVIGVSTLEAMAYGAEGEEILVVLDACREEFNVAKFQKVTRLRQDFGGQAEGYRRLQEDEVVDTSEVMARLKVVPPETILVFSEKIAGNRDIQSQVSGHKKRIVTYPKGENVARLGLGIIEKGDSPSLFAVQPKYSHHPNIRTFPGAR
jgi:tRNA A37 threonylcarbamoyladenosine modification protein TsaB